MIRTSRHRLTTALAFVLAWTAACPSAFAQEVVQPLPGTTDADKLADTMRQLAGNPRNVDALVRAGELSIGLGDLSGAAALFARVEKIDPRNARMKAGMASILVRSERPGEALRYFGQAESFGLAPRDFAADRGLAYDLIGQQDRAQRDYRVALRDLPDDETVRRYALSLGISGKRDEALKLLDPLIAKTDRGAWRARAFILAMTDDVPAAEKIATTMMPGTMAQGLLPFFKRLPSLSPADRAFAVHFGEVSPTPERIADARMTPVLPALGPDATAPMQMAAAAPVATPAEQKGRTRDRKAKVRTETAAASSARPVQPSRTAPPVTLASATPIVRSAVRTPGPEAAPPFARPTPVVTAPVPAPVASAPVASAPPASGELPKAVTTQMAAMPPATQPAPSPAPVVPAPVKVETAPGRAVAASEDSILARIIAGLSIPASELGVGPAPAPIVAAAAPIAGPAATDPEDGARVIAEAKAKAERDAAAKKRAADALAAEKKKAVADRKLLAEKKAAADKKAVADKAAAEEKRIARANPARIWVQVAGGATEGDLPKAWRAVRAKAPEIFGSRGGWTTPLRATNRVLAGPFKTDAEARTFVNQLAKAGVSAFSFTSDAGQVVTKLPAK